MATFLGVALATECNVTRPNKALATTSRIIALFVPPDSYTLWSSVWVMAAVTRDPYVQYLSTTFLWFDTALSNALTTVCRKLAIFSSSCDSCYCSELQLTTAFYITLLTHSLVRSKTLPHPITVILFTISSLIAAAVLLDTMACTFLGALAAVGVGAATGIARVLCFNDFFR